MMKASDLHETFNAFVEYVEVCPFSILPTPIRKIEAIHWQRVVDTGVEVVKSMLG